MIRRATASVILTAFLVTGCASPYAPNTGLGGVDAKMIGPSEGVVVVQTNAATGAARAQQMLLARSAELTLAAGMKRFSLLTIEDPKALEAQKAGRLADYLRQSAGRSSGQATVLSEKTQMTVNRANIEHTRHGGGFFVVMYDSSGGAYDAGEIAKRLVGKL